MCQITEELQKTKAISVLIQMPTTYLRESRFSCLFEIKSLKKNPITPINTLMREAIKKNIIPRFGMLVDNMQQQQKSFKIIS